MPPNNKINKVMKQIINFIKENWREQLEIFAIVLLFMVVAFFYTPTTY